MLAIARRRRFCSSWMRRSRSSACTIRARSKASLSNWDLSAGVPSWDLFILSFFQRCLRKGQGPGRAYLFGLTKALHLKPPKSLEVSVGRQSSLLRHSRPSREGRQKMRKQKQMEMVTSSEGPVCPTRPHGGEAARSRKVLEKQGRMRSWARE